MSADNGILDFYVCHSKDVALGHICKPWGLYVSTRPGAELGLGKASGPRPATVCYSAQTAIVQEGNLLRAPGPGPPGLGPGSATVR